jgi:DNA-binding NtrC family response regulator
MPATMPESAPHRLESAAIAPKPGYQEELAVLVVSANLESRREVCKILEALCVQVIPCCSLAQAAQVLSLLRPNLVFCDEQLPDGSYADVLEWKHSASPLPPVVVLTRNGEWEFYINATQRGAFDVIRSPWCPTDIELSFIRGIREGKYRVAAAR